MKRQHAVVLLMLGLGSACVAHAQEAVPNIVAASQNVAAPFSAAAITDAALFQPADSETLFAPPSITSTPAVTFPLLTVAADATPEPSPTPAPDPTFLYGGRDDYRWQLGIGVDWLRFRSSLFNASAVGLDSSVTYFTNDWFGIEGNVATGFAPEIYDREHVKLLVYGAGPKIAWRQNKWEPWAHVILGGAHEQPQTADNSRNAFSVEAGGGTDYRFNPRFSGRLEADWIHTSFFSQSQNNFKLMGGVVFHF
ncbi:MAG: hypothetical protein WBE13_07675 [Candidatus Acidiferrum sp.]